MDQRQSLPNHQLRIGLLPAGGKKWIAGTIYLHNIIRALACLPGPERPSLFLIMPARSRWEHMRELKELQPQVRYYSHRDRDERKEKWWYIRQSLLAGKWPSSFESLLERLRLQALFPVFESLGKNFPVPWLGWIPDFQHKHLPQFFSKKELQQRDARFQRLIDEAPHVVVSSQDAFKDLMRWFPKSKERVSILRYSMIPMAEWYEQHLQTIIQKFHLPQKYLMFPSQFWVHKNHHVLFEAMRILKGRGLEDIALVCTGFQQDYRVPDHFERLKAFIAEHNLSRHIYLPGLLTRSDQIQLLRAAVAIVQPSLFEGWSSLVEDCRTLGKRIYISDIPIHREQEPPQAQFFNPDNAEELADLIAKDWKDLKAGPDLKQEQQAREETAMRAVRFARTFLQIVELIPKKG